MTFVRPRKKSTAVVVHHDGDPAGTAKIQRVVTGRPNTEIQKAVEIGQMRDVTSDLPTSYVIIVNN